ncbi:MAG: single-stranded DNA-binding protein [Desulfurellaceae bacterium]|nr:single-stranded DNA-binding protein [Desulfurellaceae bacterium]
MASVNKAIIVGNLGRDPEVRYTQSGQAMTRFTVATTDTWTDRDNGRQERTEWHNIVVWGKQAETCGQYLSKGRQVYIEGRIQTRKFEDREGKERYFTEINAQQVTFLGGRDGGSARSGQSFDDGPSGGFDDAGAGSVPPDDDVPF